MTTPEVAWHATGRFVVGVAELLDTARDLRSVDGENLEYDRALLELVSTVLGYPADERYVVARLIGVDG